MRGHGPRRSALSLASLLLLAAGGLLGAWHVDEADGHLWSAASVRGETVEAACSHERSLHMESSRSLSRPDCAACLHQLQRQAQPVPTTSLRAVLLALPLLPVAGRRGASGRFRFAGPARAPPTS